MSGLRLLLSSRRMTTRSPYWDGMVETRTSIALRPMRSEIRPSCGRRFSAMSSFDITLIRDTSSGASLRAGCSTGRSTPSTRKRMLSVRSKVSIWISDAPSLTASPRMALIRRITGEFSSLSSRSSLSGISSVNAIRSISASMSSTSCCETPLLCCQILASISSNASGVTVTGTNARPNTRRTSSSANAGVSSRI